MDEHLGPDHSQDNSDAATAVIDEASTEFLGRWNQLVSTTNWEKGRIIAEWRQRLIESDAPAQTYSDEAWSRRVGNLSGQHAGRLRRVWDRFGDNYEQFDGPFWSHFQAALDWPDAEMYLEGVVQEGWSVAQMRAQRWEAIGSPPDEEPQEQDVVTAEYDEDAPPVDDPDSDDKTGKAQSSAEPAQAEASDFDPGEASQDAPFDDSEAPSDQSDSVEPTAPVRPFEDLPPLPDDLNDAFEALKVGIIGHKAAKWQEVSADDVRAHLDALKVLTATEQ